MRTPYTLFCTAAALTLAATQALAQDRPELVVYTYDSFVSEWGPGPIITESFEAVCECTLRFVGADDGAALLSRLRLEGARTQADVVLGLDTNLTAEAAELGLFAPHGVQVPELDMPLAWDDPLFLPFDWGHFAFVHRDHLANVPRNFRELIDSNHTVVIQDPRSSTPGLGLLMWVHAAYGDQAAEIWQGLARRIVTVTAGWSEAYGMFLDGEADLVLSYTTSPAYHMRAENDYSVRAAIFEEGHYLQIEVAGMLSSSSQPELARQFLQFMLTADFQEAIPETNWMYPVILPEEGFQPQWDLLALPESVLLLSPQQARQARGPALNVWLNALSR